MQCGKWERASCTIIFSHENEDRMRGRFSCVGQPTICSALGVGSASYIRMCSMYGTCVLAVLGPSAPTHNNYHPFLMSYT